MHIAMYADRPASYGGIETHMATLAKELVLLGHRVRLAFPRILHDGLFTAARSAWRRSGLPPITRAKSSSLRHRDRPSTSSTRTLTTLPSSLCASYGATASRTVTTLHSPGQCLPPVDGRFPTAVIAVSREISESLARRGSVAHAMIENGGADLHRFHPLPPEPGRGPRLPRRLSGQGEPIRSPRGPRRSTGAGFPRQDVECRYVANWAPKGKERPRAAVEDRTARGDLLVHGGESGRLWRAAPLRPCWAPFGTAG